MGEARKITTDLNDYGGTSLTADSRSLVTVQFDVTANVWVAPMSDLMHGKQITSAKLEGDRGLTWTPDGKIVYSSLAGGNIDLWIMNADGTNQKQLTTDSQQEASPLVSPDGRYIVFNSMRGPLPSVWRMNIDGGNVKQLTDKEDYLLAITPDSKSILFTSWRTTKMSLWRMSIDGGEPVQISNLFISGGAISPDGKWMACRYRNEDPNSPAKIIILPVEGGPPTKSIDVPVTTSGGSPGWFPDGKSLVVADSRTGAQNLRSLPLDGGPMKQLTDFKPDHVFTFDWQLAGGGKLAAMSRGTITSDVILISDFR
jgi:TolB protein